MSADSPSDLAQALGVSTEAIELTWTSEVIDLHIDTFIPHRLYGYDPRREHRLTPGFFMSHLDLPRMKAGGLSGAMWSITTNPFRSAERRYFTFDRNLNRLVEVIDGSDGALAVARDYAEYRRVRARGAHACLLAIQGGNAWDVAVHGSVTVPAREITRVTLVHLTNSAIGASSSPMSAVRRHRGLSSLGRGLVELLDDKRIFVDLAHIHPDAFWDAVEVHDASLPLIATHTGVSGVCPSWRNLDDEQLKAIADTGGVIGVIFHSGFLKRPGGPRDGRMIVEHMAHIMKVVGEDFVAIGSDYDGMIIPPPDLRSGHLYPRLVQHMLDAGFTPEQVQKALGENFLRSFERMRPGVEGER